MPRFPFAAVLLASLAATARPQPDDDPPGPVTDADVLKSVGLNPADGAALVGYLKVRTVNDADQGRLDEIVRRFAADKFEDRLAAAAAAERLGPLAISPLRKVAENKTGDPEIAYRAGLVLKKLQTVDHSKVSAAAVRGVVKLRPPGAAAALLGFLPLADSDAVADDIRTALKDLAVRDGKAEPALVAGLADDSPARRAAAYTALVEGGPADKRVRIPDAFEAVKAAVRRDPDPETKFRGLWALVHTTREKEFVPDLIGMIPVLPRGRLWQLEDLLLRLAGEYPAGGRFGRTAADLAKARDAWAGWWGRGGVDLARADLAPRVKGLTDLVLMDPTYGRAAVVALGPDLKEAWRLGGNPQLMHPYDARVLPSGRVLLAEQNYGRVTERDRAGNILHNYNCPQPVTAEVLPNGNWLVVARSMIAEVKVGENAVTVVHSYTRRAMPPNSNGFDIITGTRLPSGEVVFVTSSPQGPNLYRLDEKLAPVGDPLTTGRFQNVAMAGIDVTADG
ncbi:MAG TPA: HEAT repeat domain-containing protein, partial [Urbifossiella sp.]|nr:HEAT repeat domain-containing protein [Urbifossiella sp.]